MTTIRTIAFTGHRLDKLGGYDPQNPIRQRVCDKLYAVIRAAIQHNGTRHFITGMALGVDQWAAQLVALHRLELREARDPVAREIKLVAAIPMASQAFVWPAESQRLWWDLLDECDEIYVQGKLVTLEDLAEAVRMLRNQGARMNRNVVAALLNKRNEFMVDMADGILAVWDGSAGGTGNCVNYALRQGKPVTVMDPATGTLRKLSNAPV